MSFASKLAPFFATIALGATPALAGDTTPSAAHLLDLGAVSGVAYYTIEPQGFRVVATLVEGEGGTPVRVSGLLAPGQSLTLSTPREAGLSPVAVEISREADTLLVTSSEMITN